MADQQSGEYVAEGWWHPNVKSGQVHDHPEQPGRGWSGASHRLCELIYTKRSGAAMSNAPAQEQLMAAVRAVLDELGAPHEISPGVFAGDNLPERLRAALEELGRERGGSEALVQHRPGSWEAEHVRRLAYGADY